MPVLIVEEKRLGIPELGRNKGLMNLHQKRITKAARERLRSAYGRDCIKCSCAAEVVSGTWRGRCRINGQEYTFRIEE